jgi:integrase
MGLFVKTLHGRGNKAETVAQRLSALYAAVQLRGDVVEPQLKEWTARLVKGVANLRAERDGPPPLADAIPAEVVLEWASILSELCSSAERVDELQVRALALVVFTFLFCLRADSACSVTRQQVSTTPAYLALNLGKFKAKVKQTTRRMEVPLNTPLAKAVLAYLRRYDDTGNSSSDPLFGSRMSTAPAAYVSTAIRRVLPLAVSSKTLGLADSLGSHALRRGATVSMHSIGVPTHSIMGWGGWASPEAMTPYVRGRTSVLASPADFECFGWMPHSGVLSHTLA